jgi:hypothetical protein
MRLCLDSILTPSFSKVKKEKKRENEGERKGEKNSAR